MSRFAADPADVAEITEWITGLVGRECPDFPEASSHTPPLLQE